jgi:hypothetical protein
MPRAIPHLPRAGACRPLAAFVLAVTALLLSAGVARADVTASFTYSPANPRAGEQIALQATSTATSTAPLVHRWDLDGDGDFDDATGDAATTAFALAGSYVVRLKAASGAQESTAEKTIKVGGDGPPPPPPPPADPGPGNQPPVARYDRRCSRVGTLVLCAGLFVREERPVVLDASPSHDPDGSIVKFEWDLDGNGSFETDSGGTPTVTHTFRLFKGLVDPRKRVVRVRVTDNKGATGTDQFTLSLLEPGCEDGVRSGRLTATSVCLRPRSATVDGEQITRYTAKLPVVVNGITLAPNPGRSVTIDVPAAAGSLKPRVRSNGAVVSAPAQGSVATFSEGTLDWALTQHRLQGFKVDSSARLNGLRITGMPSEPVLSDGGGSSTMRFFLALPQQFGGSTSDQPITISPGKAAAAASQPLSFVVANAAIGPIGLKELKVSFDGVDFWEIAASIALPDPIPYTLKGDAGIRNGAFEHAGAAIEFGTPGIGPFGPVYLQSISFRVEIKPKKSKCVPKVGTERIDLWAVYRKVGVEPDPSWPRYGYIDHGVPTFALCGDVGVTAGPTILGAAAIRANAGLGFATYDDRPSVFRVIGRVSLVEIPLAKAAFEVHTDGYVKARADFSYAIPSVASIEGFLMFEMLKAKFNAEAYVKACVDLVDLCAGARALVSSKGLAVCLRVEVLGANWTPGFGYRWGATLPTPYFTGCDVGPYRERIVRAATAGRRAVAAGAEQPIDLPAGLPGAVIVAEGRDAPPKISVIGPNGERVTAPDGMQAVQQKPFLLIKNLPGRITQVAIGKPAAGRWRVVVEDGSSEIVSIRSANGLPEPKVKAQVTGRGHSRAIAYRIDTRRGQKVTFSERGGSAGNIIGEAKGARGTLRFTPADGRSERREIVAIVEQDGQLRDQIRVASYRSPAALRPARPRRLRTTRTRSAVRVSWRSARHAHEYEVSVRLSDGRRLTQRTRGRRVTVRRVNSRVRGAVRVRGLSRAGMKGRAAAARLPVRRHRAR